MTALWVVVLAAIAVAAFVRSARRGGLGRRAAQAHHRALDTLASMSSQAVPGAPHARSVDDAQTHVRLVRADSAPGRPVLGRAIGRPGRALGASPFRAPLAPGAVGEDLGGDAGSTVGELSGDGGESVRTLRPSELEGSGPSGEEPAPLQAHAAASTPPPALEPEPVARATPDPLPEWPEPPPTEYSPADDPDEGWLDRLWAAPVTPSPAETAALPQAAALPEAATPEAAAAPEIAASPEPAGTQWSRPVPSAVAALAAAGRRQLPAQGSRRRRRGVPRAALAAAIAASAAAAVGAAMVLSGGSSPAPHHTASLAPAKVARPAPVTTPTTAAPPVTLVSSTPQDGVYALHWPATITFTATSAVSWVELRQGDDSGPVLFEGSLQPGQSQTVSGPAWIRMGNPAAVTVSVDETPIVAPALPSGQPYNLQFR